jgi:NAD+ synthase
LEKKFKTKVQKIDLTKSLDNIIKNIKVKDANSINNMKARLRMLCLYGIAQQNNALVLGTSNADEIYTGYFTKYGDGVSDLAPIGSITKKHVYEISKYLGVPETIINRTPTAGLYEGQTDEKELMVTYSEIDNFLLGKQVTQKAEKQINFLHNISAHKRNLINLPLPYKKIK